MASAPLGWDPSDPAPVAGAVCFLFSDASRAISGELIHVDGGAHAIGPLRRWRVRERCGTIPE